MLLSEIKRLVLTMISPLYKVKPLTFKMLTGRSSRWGGEGSEGRLEKKKEKEGRGGERGEKAFS